MKSSRTCLNPYKTADQDVASDAFPDCILQRGGPKQLRNGLPTGAAGAPAVLIQVALKAAIWDTTPRARVARGAPGLHRCRHVVPAWQSKARLQQHVAPSPGPVQGPGEPAD